VLDAWRARKDGKPATRASSASRSTTAPTGPGALITDVTADSPAGAAGIETATVVAIRQAAIDGARGSSRHPRPLAGDTSRSPSCRAAPRRRSMSPSPTATGGLSRAGSETCWLWAPSGRPVASHPCACGVPPLARYGTVRKPMSVAPGRGQGTARRLKPDRMAPQAHGSAEHLHAERRITAIGPCG
jgi:hypothetical protein